MNSSIFKKKSPHNSFEYDEKEIEEHEKCEYILSLVETLKIEDFPADIPEKSKQNIERALKAVKIRNHIDLGGCQTLLALNEFKISNLQLTYQEKKFIEEQVQRLIDEDNKQQSEYDTVQAEAEKLLEKFYNENKAVNELSEKLLRLKCEEFELMLAVAKEIASESQQKRVEELLQKTKIQLLQIKVFNKTIQESEMSKTLHSREALQKISENIVKLHEEKRNVK